MILFADIHNHILPGIDDGAVNMADALLMARLAVDGGTDIMAATPHEVSHGRRTAPPDWLRGLVFELQQMLDSKSIPLRIVPGVEIKLGSHVASGLTQGKVMSLGDAGQWVLLEPPFDRLPPNAASQVRAIFDAGFQVVVAHPERCREVQQTLAFVEACAAQGAAFQLTSGSLLGHFGAAAQGTAELLLRHADEFSLVIASDTHDAFQRSPNLLAAARDRAAGFVGPEQAQAMVDTRPRAMLLPKG